MENQANRRYLAFAMTGESVRAKLCAMALAAVPQGNDLAAIPLFLCPACGHIEPGEPPTACPVCEVPAQDFVKI